MPSKLHCWLFSNFQTKNLACLKKCLKKGLRNGNLFNPPPPTHTVWWLRKMVCERFDRWRFSSKRKSERRLFRQGIEISSLLILVKSLPVGKKWILQKCTFSWMETSRERPKLAPYLRLKNSKRTSKCQVFPSTVPAWGKKMKKKSRIFF